MAEEDKDIALEDGIITWKENSFRPLINIKLQNHFEISPS